MLRPRQQEFIARLKQHQKILFKIAGAYSSGGADQNDLIQEMKIQLWQSFRRFDGRSQFSTWIYRVALNVAISWSRNESRRKRHTVPIDDVATVVLPISSLTEKTLADLDLLHKMLGRLNELDRALILLYLEGHDHNVMADVLGISTTNIATKISRIKQRLQQEFND